MAKRQAAKLPLVPEDRLALLRPEIERLVAVSGKTNDFRRALGDQPYYHAVLYYAAFAEHLLLSDLQSQLGPLDDAAALANAYFWYTVAAAWSGRIEPGSNPLDGEMEGVEDHLASSCPGGEDQAIWEAAVAYVAGARRRGAATKAATTRKRRAAGAKAAQTKKRKTAGRKAAATRRARQAEPGAAADGGA